MNLMPKTLFLILLLLIKNMFAQVDSSGVSSNEIFVIDSYITPEKPHKLIVSFSTDDSSTSVIVLQNIKTFIVSNSFTDNHKIEIELDGIKSDSTVLKYFLSARSKNGVETKSDLYEVELPRDISLTEANDVNWTQMCLGGLVYAIPGIEYVGMDGGEYLGLYKELPVWSFYSGGYNYPQGYFGIEYAHYLSAPRQNFLRFGYKHIFQFDQLKYISPGLSLFGDFKGYNGLSAEISVGLFQIKNIFTFYTRYRYNFQLKQSSSFYEFAFGLYANFFSFNF